MKSIEKSKSEKFRGIEQANIEGQDKYHHIHNILSVPDIDIQAGVPADCTGR